MSGTAGFTGSGSTTFGTGGGGGGGAGVGSGSGLGSTTGAGSGGAAAVSTFMSHTSASTEIGVLLCQLMPKYRKASSRTCTATASRIAGVRLGSGGTVYGAPGEAGFTGMTLYWVARPTRAMPIFFASEIISITSSYLLSRSPAIRTG